MKGFFYIKIQIPIPFVLSKWIVGKRILSIFSWNEEESVPYKTRGKIIILIF
jgi:hypothetical protein